MSTAAARANCPHCGMLHETTCPRIKAIDYHPNGLTKRIEFHPPAPIVSGPDPKPNKTLLELLWGDKS